MEKQPRHRPQRSFVDAKRVIVECTVNQCIHCGSVLVSRRPWHYEQDCPGHEWPHPRGREEQRAC